VTTAVILDGAMGKKFGKRWDLCVNSPAEAIRMIGCNEPSLPYWVRDNLVNYEGYQVTCEYENGITSDITEQELFMDGKIISIRFTPVLKGSGKFGAIILGAVIIIAAVALQQYGFLTIGQAVMAGLGGVAMMAQGIVSILTPQPSMGTYDTSSRVDKTSYYFNGPANTVAQGVPVSLIYGTCLVGSHPISASLTVDDSSEDEIAPTIVTFSPSNGAVGVATTTNIVLTFSETVKKGAGTIRIRKDKKSGTVFESINVATSGSVTINGSQVTINPLTNLAANTTYFVVLPSGCFKDWVNNKYLGTSIYSFTTGAA
jgi:predicted phage tail protein